MLILDNTIEKLNITGEKILEYGKKVFQLNNELSLTEKKIITKNNKKITISCNFNKWFKRYDSIEIKTKKYKFILVFNNENNLIYIEVYDKIFGFLFLNVYLMSNTIYLDKYLYIDSYLKELFNNIGNALEIYYQEIVIENCKKKSSIYEKINKEF